MKISHAKTKRNIISLTPLIDIVFILLIFFMLASSFAEWQFIELGIGEASEIRADSSRSSIIKLNSDGSYMLNNKQKDVEEIVAIVRERCRINTDHPIIIQPLKGVKLQSLVSLLDMINEFANENVSLAKEDV